MNGDSKWNRRIDDDPVDMKSSKLLASIKHHSGPFAGHTWLHPDFGPGGDIPHAVAVKGYLGTRKTRFATPDELRKLTGLPPGAIPPFGQPVLPFELFADGHG